jgi:hypothetical protein
VKECKKNWKSLGIAYGPLISLRPGQEFSVGGFITCADEHIYYGIVFYIFKIYVSFWWLK